MPGGGGGGRALGRMDDIYRTWQSFLGGKRCSRFFQARVVRLDLAHHRRLTPEFTFYTFSGGGTKCVSYDICVYHFCFRLCFLSMGYSSAPG